MRFKTVIALVISATAAAGLGYLVLHKAGGTSRSRRPLDMNPVPPRPAGSGPVVPEDLHRLLRSGDSLTVTDGYREEVLFRSRDRKDLLSLSDALLVGVPKEGFHCMCEGSPAIHVTKGAHGLLTLTIHHGRSIRASIWESDAPLTDSEPLLVWFDSRGIAGPRREVEDMKVRSEASARARARWLAAVPAPLRDTPEALLFTYGDPGAGQSTQHLKAALVRAEPSSFKQIRQLYGWYGSGAGPWSGFPSYEQLPEDMLLTYATADLLSAATADDLSECETEGAARLFAGWTFSQARPQDVGRLPSPLKVRLLQHSLQSTDKDKRQRAEHAFSPAKKAAGAV